MSSPRIALISAIGCVAIALAALPAFTSRRPHYGGTLTVEIGAAINSADPAAMPPNPEEASSKEQIDSLLYDHRNPDGTFSDPGPFRIAEWEPGKHATLAANEDYKSGRPFVNAIEIQMGRPVKDRLIDVELNKADLTEIPADQARRAAERGIRISRSQPDELIALVYALGHAPSRDPRIREAIALAIDRPAIVNFILQKEGEPAGALLPQWLSGTAFLFPAGRAASDLVRAKELHSQILSFPKILLGYDAGDPQAQAIAERIVVNEREAGISMGLQAISKQSAAGQSSFDAQLLRLNIPSPEPRASLQHFLDVLTPIAGISISGDELADPATPQQIYDREAAVIHTHSVFPIAWIPHVYALSVRVRDWKAPAPGETWPLADVWLDAADSTPEKGTP